MWASMANACDVRLYCGDHDDDDLRDDDDMYGVMTDYSDYNNDGTENNKTYSLVPAPTLHECKS